MGLTIESLVAHGQQLQKQLEASANLTQQTLGALTLINSQIQLMQQEEQENLIKKAEEEIKNTLENQDNGEINEQAKEQAA